MANLSPIENVIIEKLRLIQSNKFGNLLVKVDNGLVVDIVPSIPENKNRLKELQK